MKKVLCAGTFDILHKGHIKFLEDAKKQGDHLTVIVIQDKMVCKNKGRPPINNQKDRVKVIKSVEVVDEIVLVKECFGKNLEIIKSVKPDVFVLGYDQKIIDKLQRELEKNHIKIYRSKEFAKGIHSRDLRKG
ncbi:adenylyltransferase/cytidyltransferase family protein [Candidatus Pacearchaeota archaeon]|nr:adenylyltransferase/cytidyltransferase family protein [Candidatus Pacearchaeota archaeon]